MKGGPFNMEIERINENTIKFYISYADIEDRGFEKEEIWYDRERSEQLFWQMMEEINGKEDFIIDGPLWIQVQALEKGLEVVVTRSQISKNEEFKIMGTGQEPLDIPMDERIEKLLESKFGRNQESAEKDELQEHESDLPYIFIFDSFEDVIQLSHYSQDITEGNKDTLYSYEGKYYLHVEFPEENLDENAVEDQVGQILEFSNRTSISIHRLKEYGNEIIAEESLLQTREYFPATL